MRLFGTTERRVVAAILVTAVVPLVLATLFTQKLLERVSATAFQPEFGAQLDRSLGVYQDLAKSIKQAMRAEATAIARAPGLASTADAPRVLAAEVATHPSLLEVSVTTCDGATIAHLDRGKPIDPTTERTLTVRKLVGGDEDEGAACDESSPLKVNAVFVTPRARLEEVEAAEAFTRAYHQIERDHRTEYLDATYTRTFMALFVATIAVAIALGVAVARPVARRIAKLASAMKPVAAGDLSVRARLEGDDEIGDLGRAFDQMLEELEQSRARVEFLKRMSEFQKMARRLAHEIKNPLTPIQLAVEEAHRRYEGDDPKYRRVVQTMLEVVTEEIASLRRLVSEFSSFARLPRADLHPGDLAEFLREQMEHVGAGGDGDDDEDKLTSHITIASDVPTITMPAAFDREMLHRVLMNLVRNAAQALRDARPIADRKGIWGEVKVTAHENGDAFTIDVDDSGPGIPLEVRGSLFDPYVTTKRDGTGLGLSIVKKVIVDHGGTIEAIDGPLGGARLRIRIPREGTAAARAALERAHADRPDEPPSSKRA